MSNWSRAVTERLRALITSRHVKLPPTEALSGVSPWGSARTARPGALAWGVALTVSFTMCVTVWATGEVLRDRHDMQRELRQDGALWDETILEQERDFDRLLEWSPKDCDERTIRRIVSVSFTSRVARAYFLRPADAAPWCGPLGERRMTALPPLPRSGEVVMYVEPSIRSHGLRIVSVRERATLIAELDPNIMLRFSNRAPRALGRWDRYVLAGRSEPVPWMNLRASEDSPLLWEQSLPSPDGRVRIIQRVHLSHVLTRVLESLTSLAVISLAFAVVLLSLLQARLRDRANPLRRLESALRKRRFEPFVQPIVDVRSGRCVGGEVLMRWAHPARGLMPPSEFIGLAEESRLIVPMSDLVMAKARDRLAPIVATHRALYFSFNITPAQLRTPGFDSTLDRIFDVASLPRQHVLLEITERDVVDSSAEETLRALRNAGYKLALDDFGTGQSNLASIDRVPVDRLKIDREFVRQVDRVSAERPVLDTIISLAHTLQTPLIAEGVETDVQWDYLANRGVQYVQGYLVARPMSIDEFTRWIDAYHADLPEIPSTVNPTPRRTAPAVDSNARAGTMPAEAMPVLTVEQMLAEMRGLDGVDVRDRRHHLRRYPQCFVAAEAVTWMMQRWSVSRAVAVRLGERLTALGYIEHVVSEHDFSDSYLFFRFVSSETAASHRADTALPDLDAVTRQLRGPDGIDVGARRRHLLWYDDSFTGRALHAWLQRQYALNDTAALGVGRALMLRGDVVHVFDDRPFEATGELYRLR